MNNAPPQPDVQQQSEPGLNPITATVEVTGNDEVARNDTGMSTGLEVSSSPSLGSRCATYNF